MPFHDSVRLNKKENLVPILKDVSHYDPKESVSFLEFRAFEIPLVHGQLLAQSDVFECNGGAASKQQSE